MMAGGHTEASTDITADIISLVTGVKDGILSASSGSKTAFEVVSFRRQVVAGTIHHVKVHTGDGVHVHAKIFSPLPHTNNPPELQVGFWLSPAVPGCFWRERGPKT